MYTCDIVGKAVNSLRSGGFRMGKPTGAKALVPRAFSVEFKNQNAKVKIVRLDSAKRAIKNAKLREKLLTLNYNFALLIFNFEFSAEGTRGVPSELKHLSSLWKRKQKCFAHG